MDLHNISRRNLLDIGAAVMLVYASVWIYEIGNYLSMAATGFKATIAMAGFMPVGAVGLLTRPTGLSLAKLIQVGLTAGLMSILYLKLKASRLSVTTLTSLATIGVYTGSIYWEFLSALSSIPMLVHQGVFTALSFLVIAAIMQLEKARSPLLSSHE